MERIGVDILGPFPVTEAGNRFVLVAMDYFMKWSEAYAVLDMRYCICGTGFHVGAATSG